MIRRRSAPPLDPFDEFARSILPPSTAAEVLNRLRPVARTVRLDGKSVLFDEADDQLGFIEAGATKLVAHASGGREQVVAFHFSQDLVWLPAGAVHHYALYPLGQATLVVFPAERFLAAVRDDAAVLGVLLERIRMALLRSREKAVSLGRKSAQEKVAGFLLSMASRIGTGDRATPEIDLPMSRRDIADNLGLTIETVSRQFGELREGGVIETAGRSHVRLCDLAVLEARAGHVSRVI